MFGLRQKLTLGFGGLLTILVIVSVLSAVVLGLYSSAMSQYLAENYRSVRYGQRMNDALGPLDDAAQRASSAATGGAGGGRGARPRRSTRTWR